VKKLGLVIAATTVLAANAAALVLSGVNRTGAADAELVLTERELRLPPAGADTENTALFLSLEWNWQAFRDASPPDWFDRAKLESLGIDCSYPLLAPSAKEHYGRMLQREVFLVLEYDGGGWRRWLESAEKEHLKKQEALEHLTEPGVRETKIEESRQRFEAEREGHSRLFVVDAGLVAAELRQRYPDRSRFAIVRGTVRPAVEESGAKNGEPFLRGHVTEIAIAGIHVAKNQRKLLDELLAGDRQKQRLAPASSTDRQPQPWNREPKKPRYAVTVRYGSRLEPWVVAVRAMTGPTLAP
jgi:hypothetical protein